VPDESFSAQLRQRRLAESLTQAELAERLGTSQQTIGNWERAEESPGPRFHVALAEYLGLPGEASVAKLIAEQKQAPLETTDTSRTPSDAEIMKMLATTFVTTQARREAAVSHEQLAMVRDELSVVMGFISYFQLRATDV
jgi:transcriptional regulator with XRE-family HTH domain